MANRQVLVGGTPGSEPLQRLLQQRFTNPFNFLQHHDRQATMRLLQRLSSGLKQAQAYELASNQQQCLQKIPADDLRQKAQAAFDSDTEHALGYDDHLLMVLLEWFKSSFFTWVNSPACARCGGETEGVGGTEPNAEERRYGAGVTELHQCKNQACGYWNRFARLNDPVKLLETRRGRCGEWCNAFALICRSMGLDIRVAHDFTDHVWIEHYSTHLKRWVHADACENKRDCPNLYEGGWGKKLTYVITTGAYEVVDTTRRYTTKYNEVLTRRTDFSERLVDDVCRTANTMLVDSIASAQRREYVKQRQREEQDELHGRKAATPAPSATQDATQQPEGRTTGSLDWRAQRGELGEQRSAAPADQQCTVPAAVAPDDTLPAPTTGSDSSASATATSTSNAANDASKP